MSPKKKAINAREKFFCYCCVETMSPVQAAAVAGYSNPEKSASLLMARREIVAELNRICEKRKKINYQSVQNGYEKIAFGDVSDAVSLLFAGKVDRETLREYDLFNVAEIKVPKEGAMEIKFADRLKAMERLEELYPNQNQSGSDFYRAIIDGLKEGERGKV